MSMATAMKWKAVGVDLTQGFIQAELPKDGKAIYISPPPGHVEEPDVVLLTPCCTAGIEPLWVRWAG